MEERGLEMVMDDQVLQDALASLLRGEAGDLEEALVEELAGTRQGDWPEDVEDVLLTGTSTFEQEGVMTYNKGLVLRFSDGSEFQLTLVRSR